MTHRELRARLMDAVLVVALVELWLATLVGLPPFPDFQHPRATLEQLEREILDRKVRCDLP